MVIQQYLQDFAYPGRLILTGTAPNGSQVLAYALTGRSPKSRDRVLREAGTTVSTALSSAEIATDTSLILYDAVVTEDNTTVISNGTHGIQILQDVSHGMDVRTAATLHTYEPDPPIYTPRIFAIRTAGSELATFGIIYRDGTAPCRKTQEICCHPGVGYLIHTYHRDGGPEVPFTGPPVAIELPDTAQGLSEALWDSLDASNKIAVFVRYGEESTIINKQQEEPCRRYH